MLLSFLRHVWTPRVMVLSLERLFDEHLLSRKEGSQFEELFLLRCDKHGQWTTHSRR